jgi:excisionase family DNA binding protein
MSELAPLHIEPQVPDVLSVEQAAAELNITPRAVRHRIKAGTIAAIKLGPGTAGYVISRNEVERAKAAA